MANKFGGMHAGAQKQIQNKIVDLNIGGQLYSTTRSTLVDKYPSSKLARSVSSFLKDTQWSDKSLIEIIKDQNSRLFIDRDGAVFKYILDFLRLSSGLNYDVNKMVPSFEIYKLKTEADFYGLKELVRKIDGCRKLSLGVPDDPITNRRGSKSRNESTSSLVCSGPYYISIGCRGYYSAERDNPTTDMTKFRKITRITVSGRSDIAKEIFSGDLNESRDPDRFPPYGYTCRYYLTHTYLEYAFETLANKGFELVTSFSTGNQTLPSSNKEEFKQWSTYVEYLFYKKPIYSEANNVL